MDAWTDQRPGRVGVVAAAVVALLALIAVGCTSGGKDDAEKSSTSTSADVPAGSTDQGAPTTGGKLVIAVPAETDGWNPAVNQWADAGNFVGSSIFEPIAVLGSDGTLYPWLAESWSSSEDNQIWTIKLREGIEKHNGEELSSDDLVASLELNVNAGLAAAQLQGMVTNIAALDRYTVQVDLASPWPTYPTTFAGISGYVVPKEMAATENKSVDQPMGTGPYKFESWIRDDSLDVVAFHDYWGGPCALAEPDDAVREMCEKAGVPLGQPNGPFLEAIRFRPITDAQQRAEALESGAVNMIMTLRPQDVTRFEGVYQVVEDYDSEKTFVMLDSASEPFDNIHARRAVAYATDFQAVIDRIDSGQGVKRDTSPFSQTVPLGVAPEESGALGFDPDKAREEIEAYKADTGRDSLSFTLSGPDNADDLATMRQLTDEWSTVGIAVHVSSIEQVPYIAKVSMGQFQAALFRNYGSPEPDLDWVFFARKTTTPVPVTFMGTTVNVFMNFSRYASDTTEEHLSTGRTQTDPAVRKEAYANLTRERNDQALDIWLYNTPYALIADDGIGGLDWFGAYPFGTFDPKPWVGGLWVGGSSAGGSIA